MHDKIQKAAEIVWGTLDEAALESVTPEQLVEQAQSKFELLVRPKIETEVKTALQSELEAQKAELINVAKTEGLTALVEDLKADYPELSAKDAKDLAKKLRAAGNDKEKAKLIDDLNLKLAEMGGKIKDYETNYVSKSEIERQRFMDTVNTEAITVFDAMGKVFAIPTTPKQIVTDKIREAVGRYQFVNEGGKMWVVENGQKVLVNGQARHMELKDVVEGVVNDPLISWVFQSKPNTTTTQTPHNPNQPAGKTNELTYEEQRQKAMEFFKTYPTT